MQVFVLCACGFSLPIESKDSPAGSCLLCGEPMLSACPHCLVPLRSPSMFCAHCGERVFESTEEDDASTTADEGGAADLQAESSRTSRTS